MSYPCDSLMMIVVMEGDDDDGGMMMIIMMITMMMIEVWYSTRQSTSRISVPVNCSCSINTVVGALTSSLPLFHVKEASYCGSDYAEILVVLSYVHVPETAHTINHRSKAVGELHVTLPCILTQTSRDLWVNKPRLLFKATPPPTHSGPLIGHGVL